MAKKLTNQERQPHQKLAQVRNAVAEALGLERAKAAAICNHFRAKDCEAVLKAAGDKKKVEAAVKAASVPDPDPVEPAVPVEDEVPTV